jgi:hypothetical protein
MMRWLDARRIIRSLSPIGLAVVTAIIAFAPLVHGAAASKEAQYCGGTWNTVEREFELKHASDFETVFPAAGRIPELEVDSRPAHVVVFSDNFDSAGISTQSGPDGKAPIVADVVCVIMAEGFRNVYYNVSKAGATMP